VTDSGWRHCSSGVGTLPRQSERWQELDILPLPSQ
jgi:hypothetical protein